MILAATNNCLHYLPVPSQEEQEESQPSPLGVRTGLDLEYKYVTTQNQMNVEDQLKANMLLFTARHIIRQIELLCNTDEPITTLKKWNKISTYGLSFGLTKPVLILKLVVVFSNSKKV